MRRQIQTAVAMTAALVVLCGLVYPFTVLGIGQVAFHDRANGSFVEDASGNAVGSSLIGQSFTGADGSAIPKYFQSRPSAAGADGYDAMSSSASNLGPSNEDLRSSVAERARAYRELNGLATDAVVPVDAVTASGSGLDPHISVANARLQAARVAQARGLAIDDVLAAIDRHTAGRPWGVLGEKAVNVLELNLDLDRSS